MSIKIIKNKLYQVDKFFSKILYDKEFGYYNKNIHSTKKVIILHHQIYHFYFRNYWYLDSFILDKS